MNLPDPSLDDAAYIPNATVGRSSPLGLLQCIEGRDIILRLSKSNHFQREDPFPYFDSFLSSTAEES